jgi:hypothetical protein
MAQKKNPNIKACIQGRVGDDFGRLTDDEYNDIIDAIEQRRNKGASELEAIAPALEEAARQKALVKRAAMLTVIRRKQALFQIGRFSEGKGSAKKTSAGRFGKLNEDGKPTGDLLEGVGKLTWEGLAAFLAGSNQRSAFSRVSVDSGRSVWGQRLLGQMTAEIEKAGLTPFLEGSRFLGATYGGGANDIAIAKEMEAITKKGLTPGLTQSKQAMEAARIFVKFNKMALKLQNMMGGYIRELPGFVASQTHVPIYLQRAGRDGWIDYLMGQDRGGKPRIDIDRTFYDPMKPGPKTPADVRARLSAIFEDLVNGSTAKSLPVGEAVTKMGPKSEAKKVSESRVIHMVDAEAFTEYNAKFGHGTLYNAVLATLEGAASSANLMERFGPNPEPTLDFLINAVKASDTGRTDAGSREKEVRALFAAATGKMDTVVNQRLATVSGVASVVQRLSLLGTSLVSSLGDPFVQAARMTFNGVPYGQAVLNQLDAMIFSQPNAREMALSVGVGIDSVRRDIAAKWDGALDAGRVAGKVQNHFFTTTGNTWWEGARGRGFVAGISAKLASHNGKLMSDLPVDLRAELVRNGIGPTEWELIRKHGMAKTDSGFDFIDPGTFLRNLTNEEVLSYMGRQSASASAIERTKLELEGRLRNYYGDQYNQAVMDPGVRQKAAMRLYNEGAQRGTWNGEALAQLFLFKGYPMQFIQRVLGQFAEEDHMHKIVGTILTGRGNNNVLLAKLMGSLFVMGTMTIYLRDFLKNQTPRDITDPAMIGAIAAQSGGLGIYGDFLFNMSDRYGNSFYESMSGPLAGDISKLTTTIAAIGTGSYDLATTGEIEGLQKAGEKAFWFAKENTPYTNIWYARGAMDYLIFQNIAELMSPGAVRRKEEALRERTGQEYLFEPMAMQ